jgi:hypothetical protein
VTRKIATNDLSEAAANFSVPALSAKVPVRENLTTPSGEHAAEDLAGSLLEMARKEIQ